MKITATQQLTIDPQYELLINEIIEANWGILTDETMQDAIIRLLGARLQGSTLWMVTPALQNYFGKQGQAQFDARIQMLNDGALTTLVVVE